MDTYTMVQLYRLNRCIKRLNNEYAVKTPDIIKKVELLLIKEISDDLSIHLKGE